MAIDIKIHPLQVEILRVLLFKPTAKFSELNTLNTENDHFNFHVKSLVGLGIIEKTDDKKYQLTAKGKEFANKFDTDSKELERQAKIGVLIGCVRQHKGQFQFLVQQRLKQPYFGFHGFLTGKIRWGETVEDTACRELKEETGLTGKCKLAGIKHKMDYGQDGHLLEDKFFFVFRVDEPEGELLENFEGGKNLWLSKEQIYKLPDLFDGVDDTLKIIMGNKITFDEFKYRVDKY